MHALYVCYLHQNYHLNSQGQSFHSNWPKRPGQNNMIWPWKISTLWRDWSKIQGGSLAGSTKLEQQKRKFSTLVNLLYTDYGRPMKPFSLKSRTFGLALVTGIFNLDRKFHRKGQWIFIVKFYVDSKIVSEKFVHRHYPVLKNKKGVFLVTNFIFQKYFFSVILAKVVQLFTFFFFESSCNS